MREKKPIVVFLMITAFLSTICYIARIAGGDAAGWVAYILMWCPGIAALLTAKIFYPREKVLGFHKFKLPYLFLAIVVPVLYLVLSYGLYWVVDRASLNLQASSIPLPQLLLSLVLAFLISFVPTGLLALGEEIGWRGFLLPKMAELWSVRAAVIVSGAVWAAWHFPLMLAGVYQAGTPVWYQLPLFTVELIAMTAILAYLRLKSNSVWPAVFFHASHNSVDQAILQPLAAGERIVYFAGETGIITVAFAAIIAVVLFRKAKNDRVDRQTSNSHL
jgi:membrane protease YdiL (CAAX protease family)